MEPKPTPIKEIPDFDEMARQTIHMENPSVGGMDADAAVSEMPPATSGPLPRDEQDYFDQQRRELDGQA